MNPQTDFSSDYINNTFPLIKRKWLLVQDIIIVMNYCQPYYIKWGM